MLIFEYMCVSFLWDPLKYEFGKYYILQKKSKLNEIMLYSVAANYLKELKESLCCKIGKEQPNRTAYI